MAEKGRAVCVTGAGGFAASWLVKLLLEQGYTVHGTVRDPNDEKNAHLKKLGNATENLRLFKADLLDYVSLSASIAGCEGVFHTACPVPSSKVSNPENEMIAPALDGTLNVLKACSEAKVKRVIVVSSVAAVNMNPSWPHDKILDEQCWSDKEFCKTTEAPSWRPQENLVLLLMLVAPSTTLAGNVSTISLAQKIDAERSDEREEENIPMVDENLGDDEEDGLSFV